VRRISSLRIPGRPGRGPAADLGGCPTICADAGKWENYVASGSPVDRGADCASQGGGGIGLLNEMHRRSVAELLTSLAFVEPAGNHHVHIGTDAADVAPHFVAVHAGHSEIQQHAGEQVVQAAEEVGALSAIAGFEHRVAKVFE